MGINYKEIKNQFTTKDVLRDFFGQYSPNKEGYYTCPAGHSSKSGKSFTINHSGFKCWNCGVGGEPINLLTEFKKMPFPKAVEACAEKYAPHLINHKNKPRTKRYLATEYLKDVQAQFADVLLPNTKGYQFVERYLSNRNLPNIIEKYGIGFSKELTPDLMSDYVGLTKDKFFFSFSSLFYFAEKEHVIAEDYEGLLRWWEFYRKSS